VVDNSALLTVGENCPLLAELDCSHSTVSDPGLDHLSSPHRCPRLLALLLTGCRVSGAGVAQLLLSHPGLVTLQVDSHSPALACLADVEHGPSLELRTLTLTGPVPAPALCPRLESLSLHSARPDQLDGLQCYTHLTRLSVELAGPAPQPALLEVGPQLTQLSLAGISQLDLLQLAAACPHLTHLTLAGWHSLVCVWDQALAPLLPGLLQLHLLNTQAALLPAPALRLLLTGAANLTTATFEQVESLTDPLVVEVAAAGLPRLQSLKLERCHSLSGEALSALLSLPRLTQLACWSCRFISLADTETVKADIRCNQYDLHLSWYPWCPEDDEVQQPILEEEYEGDEDDEEEEEDWEWQEPEFFNYWNNYPLRGAELVNSSDM